MHKGSSTNTTHVAGQKNPGNRSFFSFSICCVIICLASVSCKHDHLPSLSTGAHDYVQVTLVSDTIGFDAARVDTHLVNAWGMAIGKTGTFWISSQQTGETVIYDAEGAELLKPVAIPFHNLHKGSKPTGAVYNATSSFVVNGKTAKFIYATENGTIAAWTTGDSTITVADRSGAGAVYKGLAIANDGTGDYIYVADFYNGKVDVFDQSFNYVTNKQFSDPSIPAGFAPFNVHTVDGQLYVTYARQKGPDNHDDLGAPGNGYINIFNANGAFVRRFISGGALNSPWGIAVPSTEFGQGPGKVLVGNFGDGRINVFDSSGALVGPLEIDGIPISVNGLWEITFHPSYNTRLYFAAGPQYGHYGIFGYLKLK